MDLGSHHRRCSALASRVELLEPRALLAAMPMGWADIGFYPSAIVADTKRNQVYVADPDNAAVRVINTDTASQVARIALAGEPGAMTLSPDGGSLIIALPEAKKVQVVSTTAFSSLRVLNVGVALNRVAAGAGNQFYGSEPESRDSDGARIVQFDAVTAKRGVVVTQNHSSDAQIRTDASGNRLYVSNEDNRGDRVIQSYDVTEPAHVKLAQTYTAPNLSFGDLWPDAAAGRLYVNNREDMTVGYFGTQPGVTDAFWALDGEEGGGIGEGWGSVTSLAAVAGAGVLYAGIERIEFEDSGVRAYSTANGAVLETYMLYGSEICPQSVVVTPNGRVMFVSVEAGGADPHDRPWRLNILGSQTLTIPDAPPVVIGTLFNDKNRNNVRDWGEDWFGSSLTNDDNEWGPSIRAYLDTNGNGKWDQGTIGFDAEPPEPFEQVDGPDPFHLTAPAAGTYTLRAEVMDEYDYDFAVFTASTAGQTVTLGGGGQQVQGVNVPMVAGMHVSGDLFVDLNGNGERDYREPGLPNMDVYLDVNGDGQRQADEPAAKSYGDAFGGGFEFDARPTGGVVRLLDPNQYAFTTPPSNYLPAGLGETNQTVHFGIRAQMTVSGTLFADADLDGKRDAGEAAFGGVRVWLDANKNGRFERGEPSMITDAQGRYELNGSEPGAPLTVLFRDSEARPLATTAKLRTVQFDDWQTVIARDFGLYAPGLITLTAFTDRDGNRRFTKKDRAAAGIVVFVDADNDGKQDKNERSHVTDASGNVTLEGLKPGTYVLRARVSSKLKATTATSFTVQINPHEARALKVGMR